MLVAIVSAALNISKPLFECYQFREVILNLVSQDLKVKYKRTFFGYLWSLLNPILQLTVMSVVFSHFIRLGGVKDYSLFLFSGFLAWNFFQSSLVSASTSLLEGESFIKKVYLPKLIFPLSRTCIRAIDFLFALSALSVIGAVAHFPFHRTVIFLPIIIAIFFIFTLGMSILSAISTVFFRDTPYLLGVLTQVLYFATPILYPIHSLPDSIQKYVVLNPVYWEILLFQKVIYLGEIPQLSEWIWAIGYAVGIFLLALVVLKNLEDDLVFRL